MITKSARSRLQSFVNDAKNLLTNYVTQVLQGTYGIWTDGTVRSLHELPTKRTDEIHTARLLRQRIDHIKNTLPGEAEENTAEDKAKSAKAIGQLISEQAFTLLNRMAALRMAGERGIIRPIVDHGYESLGFQEYENLLSEYKVGSTFERYTWFVYSTFDELSIELPAVFNRYSPYGLLWFDEKTLKDFFELIGADDLSAFYDMTTGESINFWQEDETLGWIFQYYNSLEERRKMREESNKPRNSREMAVRNQFFTPDYVVRFLTDNSLGRIWWEMTGGKSQAIADFCEYLVRRPDEVLEPREIKEPTEITLLDPTCGSMHFGLYAFSVFEIIYMDAWDNHPELLQNYRYELTRDQFRVLVPKLILEKNIFGVEIDPRALQIAAVSLWLRAQKSWDEQEVQPAERPLIRKSNLVLAEPMPGNKKLLRQLTKGMDAPMKKLIDTVWSKMTMAGEAGLLLKMEEEISSQLEDIRKNWAKYTTVFKRIELSNEEVQENMSAEATLALIKKMSKEDFFKTVSANLRDRISDIASQMSDNEGYENALFADDAARGLAFIEMCMRRFDAIVMNPPFGEGSTSSSKYLDKEYPIWSGNLVSSFFIRMEDMLSDNGLLGAIFDKSILVRLSYEKFRQEHICGFVQCSADTGWNVLDANVETSTLVLSKRSSNRKAAFFDIQEADAMSKEPLLLNLISNSKNGEKSDKLYLADSMDFKNLPNSVLGYNFDENLINVFKNDNLLSRAYKAREGFHFSANVHNRLFYELGTPMDYVPVYNGSSHSLFYTTYRDFEFWKSDGRIVKAHVSYRSCDPSFIGSFMIGYGKRGDILDAHITKKNTFYTAEGLAIPYLESSLEALTILSFLNSILSQSIINLYTGQHKRPGYVNLLPMPDFKSRQTALENIVRRIIELKRDWLSLDETNLEYRGFLSRLDRTGSIAEAFDKLQDKLSTDYQHYQELVEQNDNLWMDLAKIKQGSDFRKTLNEYKSRRPYEELISIDRGSDQNIINRKTLAAEIIQELVGMAFGRWDIDYALREGKDKKDIPDFKEIFEPLPFTPPVSLHGSFSYYEINPATGEEKEALYIGEHTRHVDTLSEGIGSFSHPQAINGLIPGGDAYGNLTDAVRYVMHKIWETDAADIEYELLKLLGFDSLQEYLESPNGFFDYHFMRYTKSRRKAPIYWPLSTDDGKVFVWAYYPELGKDTLKLITLQIDEHIDIAKDKLNAAEARNDSVEANKHRQRIDSLSNMKKELQSIIALPYMPNQDDGVPVTAAPLRNLFTNRKWKAECEENWDKLMKGEYDWSHLAYAIRPAEIRTKARRDWCMALTHGLEELCENKPKEKKAKKSKNKETIQGTLDFES